MNFLKKKEISQGGNKYFQNRNPEDAELQEGLNSLKLEKQRDAMKQIIASMTIGKDVSKLFPDVVKIIRTKNIELKKLVYLYLINYAKIKPDLIFLAVAAFHSDAKEGATPLIRGLAIRTMGCIQVPEVVTYLCETLSFCFKDKDPYVRKIAALCVPKLYITSPQLVRENGFLNTLHDCLKDENPVVVANAMQALTEISVLSGANQLKLKSKNLKHILDSLSKASEWGQVSILDALILYNPKKASHAEEVIEGVLPRLSHANPGVVMSAIKVVLKFMDQIDNIDKVRNYCKKLSNSLMSVLMSYPEIQYVLLRSLHAIVQKRPMLLDKDFKYFFVQYNDPIYVKLEKVDILYKLCDNKNFEVIIKEFTSYALTETNSELIHKSVKYIGCVGYKFEKSLDICVESLSKIIENNNDEAISESIIVARDLMRKYKGRALELINKLSVDMINSLSDQNAKSAALYILGDFCTMIPKSTEMITYFVNNFSNVEYSSKVRLQILNAGVKNFVNKPDESEEIVKLCLQKGAEESENPDIRDRAYIYWRLLEIDPDIAKDMMVSEKPPFDFTDEDDLEPDVVDDMICNMTNVSAVYLKKQKDIITEEDYINDPVAKQEREEEEKEEKRRKKEREEREKEKEKKKSKEEEEKEKEKEAKKKKKKLKEQKKRKKEKLEQQQQNNEADLIGLDDEMGGTENITQENKKQKKEEPVQPQQQQTASTMDDIFSVFNNMGSTNPPPAQNTNNMQAQSANNNDPFNIFNLMGNGPNTAPNVGMPNMSSQEIFQNSNQYPTTKMEPAGNNNGQVINSQFQRNNGNIQLGLNCNGLNGPCQLILDNNPFGLTCQNGGTSAFNNGTAIFQIIMDPSHFNRQPPPYPFLINANLNANGQQIPLKINLNIIVLLKENCKLSGNPFVQFFGQNKDQPFNQNIFQYPKHNNEDNVKMIFERNNILLSARQNKANPPTAFYSANILGNMPLLIQEYLNNDRIVNIKIITNNASIVPLMKDVIDSLLN